jgi:hypothetical protein
MSLRKSQQANFKNSEQEEDKPTNKDTIQDKKYEETDKQTSIKQNDETILYKDNPQQAEKDEEIKNDKLMNAFDRLKKRGSKTIDLDKFNGLTINGLKGEPGNRLEKYGKSKELVDNLHKIL